MRQPLIVLAAGLVFLAAPVAFPQTTFVDVTDAVGLTSAHAPIPGHPMGPMVGGGTVADFNRDGWPDIYVICGGSQADMLFLNDQAGNFVEVGQSWGLTQPEMCSGAAVGDYDKDGWLDMYVTNFGPPGTSGTLGSHRLYRNVGGHGFQERAALAGLQYAGLSWDGFSPGFGDYDLDGDLDLFVTSYTTSMKNNRLFRNNGDGTFTDVTIAAGIYASDVRGFVPTFADFDGDRYPELILIGDTGTSEYYINNGDGTFTESTHTVDRLDVPNAMGVAICDVNEDMLLDFYVSDTYYTGQPGTGNKLYINQGNHVFTEEAWNYGVQDDGWGWGVIALDFDNDGLIDLGGTNGFPGPYQNYPTKLFHNQGNGTFVEMGAASGLVHNYDGRTMSFLDYDKDGDLDIALFSTSGPFKLFRNDLVNGNSYLRISLDTYGHPALAPDGVQSRVEVTVGGKTQVRYLDTRQSYLGQSEMIMHFGLGVATAADEVRVEWADGFSTVLQNVAANQEITVHAKPPFSQDMLQRGQMADFVVTGAEPGETVLFLYSFEGLGEGPANTSLGSMPIDLLAPVTQFGTAVADAAGRATLTKTISPLAPVRLVYSQAVIQRGTGGVGSVKTNTLTAPILP